MCRSPAAESRPRSTTLRTLAMPRRWRRRRVDRAIAMDICQLSAVTMARLLREKTISAREVMQSHLARIDRLNPSLNAIVTLDPERAMKGAASADERLA